jgi:uncharacterized protein (DUF1330 family)
MPAYVVAEVDSWDDVRYEDYRALAIPAVEKYGGRFLNGRSGCRREVLEGDAQLPQRLVIVEFESYERAKEWWDSAEYRVARAIRQECARSKLWLIDGRNDPPAG